MNAKINYSSKQIKKNFFFLFKNYFYALKNSIN